MQHQFVLPRLLKHVCSPDSRAQREALFTLQAVLTKEGHGATVNQFLLEPEERSQDLIRSLIEMLGSGAKDLQNIETAFDCLKKMFTLRESLTRPFELLGGVDLMEQLQTVGNQQVVAWA